MTRYFVFLILGSILGFFILLTSPLNTFWLDASGLLLLSIGSGLFLSDIKIAGMFGSFGIAVILHVIAAWWSNFYVNEILEESIWFWRNFMIYFSLTLLALILLALAIYSLFSHDKFNNTLDRIKLKPVTEKIMRVIPVLIMTLILFIVHFYFNRPY